MKHAIILCVALVACGKSSDSARPEREPEPLDTSCAADADCVPAPGCCPAPCTEHVINKRQLERAQAALKDCPDEPCPEAGGCLSYLYVCEAARCKIVYAGDPAYERRANPTK